MTWPLVPLGEVADVIAGQSPSGKYYNNDGEGMPFHQGKTEFTDRFLGEAKKWTTSVTKEAQPGDVLISVRAPVGPVNQCVDRICIGRGLAAIRPGLELDSDYLFFALRSMEAEIGGTEGAVFASINRTQIGEIQIPVPDLETQERIVALLDEATAAVTELEAVYSQTASKLDDLRASALAAAMASGEWPRLALKDVCTVDWGNTSLTKSAYVDGGEHLAVSAAGPDGRIDHFEHDAFTPVLSAIGAQCGRMFMPSEPFTAIKNTMTLTAIPGKVDRWFLFYLLESVELPRRGAAQPFLSKGDVEAFEVAVPQLTDQERIVAQLDEVSVTAEEALELAGARLETAQSLRQSVLKAAFRGEF